VVLWFAGLALVIVWQVFRDTAIDYRLIVAGVLLPDVTDAALGGARVLHTLAASVFILVVVMVGTRGRRAARRRLLALPIGTFLHLVLDAMWSSTTVFWWPVFGLSFEGAELPSLSRPPGLVLVQELVGLVALVWWWRRFRLHDLERRRAFVRTGRLGRDLVG
jgi:hypothetical protein